MTYVGTAKIKPKIIPATIMANENSALAYIKNRNITIKTTKLIDLDFASLNSPEYLSVLRNNLDMIELTFLFTTITSSFLGLILLISVFVSSFCISELNSLNFKPQLRQNFASSRFSQPHS